MRIPHSAFFCSIHTLYVIIIIKFVDYNLLNYYYALSITNLTSIILIGFFCK